MKTSKYGKLEKKNFKWIYLFLFPTIVIFVMFYLRPILVLFYTSFTKWDGFNEPTFNGIRNYIRIVTNSAGGEALRNMILWILIAVFLHVGFGTLIAFVLYERPFGWRFTRSVFMIPNIISAAAWALIYRFIFNDQMGILNSFIRLFDKDFSVQWFYKSPYAFWAVTFTWLFYAVVVTLIVQGDLMAIPDSLMEAAKLDGASKGQLIRFVQLPLCRISIGTSIICSITPQIALYEAVALTTAGGPGDDTMSLAVILVRAITDYNYGFANAVGVVMFIAGLIAMLTVNRLFRMNESVY